ncbi:metallophosphoesterase family protein [Candidatus Nitrospira neomarina]|uniref:Phosphoesterase n=1 Tax=Candidatus Nitrospira neomarina TaxID=3020899 RepID=A0AA96K4A9_9BACT|nr:metallophosphoesterase family protein [Candidatus Nitrospira neomarina]WNM63179.1 metallophosphoesterase family protein [Candidatus Nitrospira neomarina]
MIGIISDTHGLVRPQVIAALTGAKLIIHAGDIGSPEVLKTLEAIAPVIAVRGNNDQDPWAAQIPLTNVVEHQSYVLYVVHELDHLDLDPVAAEFSAVIFGHSHRASAERRKGVLYLNPGSAGPRRFTLPISVARLHLTETGLTPEIIEITK